MSLFDNRITVLEGLENLHELKVFSFGKNHVNDRELCIKYLNSLKNNLQVLKMADNPWANNASGNVQELDVKYYAIYFLKGLKYLDYELIDESMRG